MTDSQSPAHGGGGAQASARASATTQADGDPARISSELPARESAAFGAWEGSFRGWGGMPDWFWAAWAAAAAFGTYFCMYGFRKPFTALEFEDAAAWGDWRPSMKTLLLASQVGGYTLSKFIGIKVISEMPPGRRAAALLGLILTAHVALLWFALTPTPYNAAMLVGNGLCLGMVFGLVLGFLEGRRLTEALVAGLCASFILADGVTKSVGAWLVDVGVPERWMPFVAGLLYLAPLAACVGLLAVTPPPTPGDERARAPRAPMTGAQRWSLFARYGLGLSLLVVVYLLVTIVRSVRADFAPEIWKGLGAEAKPAVFTQTELFVALGVTLANGALVCVVDNRRAFFGALGVCGVGLGVLVAALAGRQNGAIDPFLFMVLVGLGLYLPYVAFHTTVFERFMAMTRERGNIGFLMYVADAIGYLGYVGVMVAKNVWRPEGDVSQFFTWLCWTVVVLSTILLALSAVCFGVSRRAAPADAPDSNLALSADRAS